MKYSLDVNILVYLANEVPGSGNILARVVTAQREQELLSAITAYELRCKILDAKASAKHVARLQGLAREFPVIEFDLPAAHAAADVRYQLGSQHLGVFDMMLAGHARRLGYTVVSADTGFERAPALRVENWPR